LPFSQGPSATDSTAKNQIRREDASFIIATFFAGLGAGFVVFWLTLSITHSILFCAVGVPLVWFVGRNMKGIEMINQAMIIYFVSAIIGVGVGFASSFGTGIPVS
jgi:uncharacterized membrane protein